MGGKVMKSETEVEKNGNELWNMEAWWLKPAIGVDKSKYGIWKVKTEDSESESEKAKRTDAQL